jgi:ribosomal protein S18 acetylase RimI-like enzyme
MKAFEQMLGGHFQSLHSMLGLPVSEKDGIKILNSGLGTSMFNIVYGCFNTQTNVWDLEIQNVIAEFKGQPFAWWVPNSNANSELIARLKKAEFVVETDEVAMKCDLCCTPQYVPKTDLLIQPIPDVSTLQDFISIIEPYDSKARSFFGKIPVNLLAKSNETLFVGSINNKPVVIGSVFESEEVSGIFNVITHEESRGKGCGSDLIGFLLEFIKKSGKKYAMLSASSDSSYRIYERLGFKPFSKLECLEYKG